jgi:diguanylate cyclase
VLRRRAQGTRMRVPRRHSLRPITLLIAVTFILSLIGNDQISRAGSAAPTWIFVASLCTLPMLSILLCQRRAKRDAEHRISWHLLSGAIIAAASALVVRGVLASGALPSLSGRVDVGLFSAGSIPFADILGLSFYPLAGLALARFIRAERSEGASNGWADAVVCGIGALALISFLALDPATANMRGGKLTNVFPLVYPVCDVFLLVLVMGGLQAWRHSRSGKYLVAAVGCSFVSDTANLFFNTDNSNVFADRVTYLWLVSAALLALIAVEPTPTTERTGANVSLGVPFAFAMTSVTLLILDRFRSVHPIALVLSGATLAAAAVRASMAFQELRTLTQTRREARTDELTQLPNRRSFSEMIGRTVAGPTFDRSPVAVLMVDLDGFKVINDTLGHHTGDELLREVARRFTATLAPGDMLARLGGDEFGIVVHPREEPGWALAAGTRLVESLQDRMELDGVPIQVRASVGASLFPDHGDTPSLLLQRADVAMYEAKRNGGGVRFYSQTFDRNSREQLEHLEELRNAIDLNQLVLYYQPKVRFVDGTLTGVEALVRWEHPTRGLLSPAEFLPLATEGGLLPQLTRKVLAIAVEQAGRWHLQGQSLGISVNVGTVDVVDATFPNFVEEVLARHQLPAALLTIEITEDSVIEDPVRTAQIVARLRQFGTKVSIDDFGAGYASLSLLRELDLDELKLDKSLVDEVDTSSRQKALVRAAVGLAHALGLSLVAEGVESADAWRELQLLDCDVAQGYLVSRPLSALDLQAWLEAQRRRLPTNRPLQTVPRPSIAAVANPTFVPALRRRPRTLPAQAWAAHPPASLPAPIATRTAS